MFSNTIKIILPLLPKEEMVLFERFMPLDFFQGGLRDLVVCVLENPEGEHYFVQACLQRMEQALEYFDEENKLSTYELFFISSWRKEVEAFLKCFYALYNQVLRTILGPGEFSFVRVISYRVSKGLYVELNYDPFAYLPHH